MKKANPFTHGGFAFFAVSINYVLSNKSMEYVVFHFDLVYYVTHTPRIFSGR
ncbi:hypothetical protein FB592_1115 [Bacillus sp. SJZ110]|nr:hypothetical protein FB592_1115 [Bacillus sp. SJZ110]